MFLCDVFVWLPAAQAVSDAATAIDSAQSAIADTGADKAKETVAGAFAASAPELHFSIDEQDVALSDKADSGMYFRLLLMLLGLGTAGVAGVSAEIVTRRKHK